MHPSRLQRGEIIAAIGGLLLALSLFLNSYKPSENPNAIIEGVREAVTAWQVHDWLRWVLLAAAVAPLILTYIVMRDHQLSWPRGEVTAVIGIFALGLIIYNGILDRPGEPSGQISLDIGWYGMFLGALLCAAGGALRSGESERRRKPPGVL
ncbi:MAG: hypothetical protein M3P50_03265 [Actinomycetota bacterium]|nr:hypothetical protein [Actinomycetota bacterium]